MSLLFKGRNQGAQRIKVSKLQKLFMFFSDNLRQAVSSLGELTRAPFASLMTIAVLGLSITLPAALYVLVKNLDRVSSDWQQASEVSVFLKENIAQQDIEQLIKRLKTWPEIKRLEYIPADKALDEFTQTSGFGDALQYLESNPLPNVILVYPTSRHAQPNSARDLLDRLLREREVELGKLDIEWLERLHAIVAIAKELVTLIAVLLFVSVILTVGNTIRLNIYNKRDEILVMKLVGATDGFIQRPFMYTGFWYGLLGGIMAWITVALILWWMGSSIDRVINLYNQSFQLRGLDFPILISMLAISVGLGLLGSYLSVKRYVAQIEPK
ncbi:permease-like cell division protein FtsX [Alteromonas sp. a30]|uniref:permease-like cell division protein FtsX n=1 Tax=Alteromonas sp. a30 TaxID=2730917 RepID=UPI002280C864|nr:permease-like cell division protein FtsX [Alteromonas sp. a30]MCY7296787.1 cell division protein FtsX [Alteromonas sp. a30]